MPVYLLKTHSRERVCVPMAAEYTTSDTWFYYVEECRECRNKYYGTAIFDPFEEGHGFHWNLETSVDC